MGTEKYFEVKVKRICRSGRTESCGDFQNNTILYLTSDSFYYQHCLLASSCYLCISHSPACNCYLQLLSIQMPHFQQWCLKDLYRLSPQISMCKFPVTDQLNFSLGTFFIYDLNLKHVQMCSNVNSGCCPICRFEEN